MSPTRKEGKKKSPKKSLKKETSKSLLTSIDRVEVKQKRVVTPEARKHISEARRRSGHAPTKGTKQSKETIAKRVAKLKGVPRPHTRGAAHPNWKGGIHKQNNGYIICIIDGKKILQHRYVMELHIGRKLSRQELVHHLNGIRSDNRIENLEITTPQKHEHFTLVKVLQKKIRKLEDELKKFRGKISYEENREENH